MSDSNMRHQSQIRENSLTSSRKRIKLNLAKSAIAHLEQCGREHDCDSDSDKQVPHDLGAFVLQVSVPVSGRPKDYEPEVERSRYISCSRNGEDQRCLEFSQRFTLPRAPRHD